MTKYYVSRDGVDHVMYSGSNSLVVHEFSDTVYGIGATPDLYASETELLPSTENEFKLAYLRVSHKLDKQILNLNNE